MCIINKNKLTNVMKRPVHSFLIGCTVKISDLLLCVIILIYIFFETIILIYIVQAFKLLCFLEESHGKYQRLPLYNGFLNACARMGRIKDASRCLDQMEYKIGKNEITYTMILKVWTEFLHYCYY